MTTTPAPVLATFNAFVAEHRSYCRVVGILEDDHDYFARTELVPPYTRWPVSGFVFVAKATGELWHGTPGEVLDKIDAMQPV